MDHMRISGNEPSSVIIHVFCRIVSKKRKKKTASVCRIYKRRKLERKKKPIHFALLFVISWSILQPLSYTKNSMVNAILSIVNRFKNANCQQNRFQELRKLRFHKE